MTSVDEIFDVIIVGCGPAGIAAAIDFQINKKIKYLILEARNRTGGRVFTDTETFGKKAPIDLGAQWLHHYRSENPLYKFQELSDNIHLNYDFILRSSEAPFFDIDGKKICSNKIDEAEQIFNDLCTKIKQTSLSIDKSLYDVIKNEYIKYENDSQIKRLIDLFFGIIEQYEASNLDQLSTKYFLKSDNGLTECNLAMPNGFGLFLEEIIQRYKLSIQLNSIVDRIDTSTSIIRISTKDKKLFLCKYVLVTIPLGCLKNHSIQFIPNLPQWKQNAIDTMGFGLSNKIFLQFPFTFWDSKLTSIFCTSKKFRFILCRSDISMLLIKLVGRVAYEIEEKNQQETIDEVMNLLRNIFSDRDVPEPIRYLLTKWNDDQFSKGSYSNFAVGTNNQTLMDLARECNDRIYWAGEHTNYNGTIGCVDSAFESGQREAKKLIQILQL